MQHGRNQENHTKSDIITMLLEKILIEFIWVQIITVTVKKNRRDLVVVGSVRGIAICERTPLQINKA